jgi:hypothetical protein
VFEIGYKGDKSKNIKTLPTGVLPVGVVVEV